MVNIMQVDKQIEEQIDKQIDRQINEERESRIIFQFSQHLAPGDIYLLLTKKLHKKLTFKNNTKKYIKSQNNSNKN